MPTTRTRTPKTPAVTIEADAMSPNGAPVPDAGLAPGSARQAVDSATEDRELLIRTAAYALYERRGHVSGRELDDWLQAEQEVDSQFAGLR